MPGIIELYRAALAADRLWSDELRRLYGKDAGDVRYQARGEGPPGSALRAAYAGFRDTSAAWRDAVTAAREIDSAPDTHEPQREGEEGVCTRP